MVDGTNGNVWLQPVRAQLGQSSLVADGGIVEPEGEMMRPSAVASFDSISARMLCPPFAPSRNVVFEFVSLGIGCI